MRTQAEWKVDTHMARVARPTRRATRLRISSAALLVKVMARIASGGYSEITDQMGDAISEYPGFSRPGACDHQNWALGSGDGLSLRGVELGEQRGVDQEVVLEPLRLHSAMVPATPVRITWW